MEHRLDRRREMAWWQRLTAGSGGEEQEQEQEQEQVCNKWLVGKQHGCAGCEAWRQAVVVRNPAVWPQKKRCGARQMIWLMV